MSAAFKNAIVEKFSEALYQQSTTTNILQIENFIANVGKELKQDVHRYLPLADAIVSSLREHQVALNTRWLEFSRDMEKFD